MLRLSGVAPSSGLALLDGGVGVLLLCSEALLLGLCLLQNFLCLEELRHWEFGLSFSLE